jgi:hypothetical protein
MIMGVQLKKLILFMRQIVEDLGFVKVFSKEEKTLVGAQLISGSTPYS